jgi:hypothetical protein
MRDVYFSKCMERAIANGQVNQYFLQEFFIHVQNKAIVDGFLGPYRTHIYGMSAHDAVQTLSLKLLRPHWSNHI